MADMVEELTKVFDDQTIRAFICEKLINFECDAETQIKLAEAWYAWIKDRKVPTKHLKTV